MDRFKKEFAPPENGLRGLKVKIAARDKTNRKEIWFLQSATLTLAFVALLVWLKPPVDQSWHKLFEKSQDTARLELPNTPAGIHIYWIVR